MGDRRMRRFSEGDLARVKYVRSGANENWHEGAIVEILEVTINNNTDNDGLSYDYIVRMFNGGKAFPIDDQLDTLKEAEVVKTKVAALDEPI